MTTYKTAKPQRKSRYDYIAQQKHDVFMNDNMHKIKEMERLQHAYYLKQQHRKT